MRTLTRLGLSVALISLVFAAWGAFAVTQLGYAWPYPEVLPDTISFHGATYYKLSGCHSRRWWERKTGAGGALTAPRLGTLSSAIGIGGIAEYSVHRHAFNGYVLVPSGSCFVQYLANASGY